MEAAPTSHIPAHAATTTVAPFRAWRGLRFSVAGGPIRATIARFIDDTMKSKADKACTIKTLPSERHYNSVIALRQPGRLLECFEKKALRHESTSKRMAANLCAIRRERKSPAVSNERGMEQVNFRLSRPFPWPPACGDAESAPRPPAAADR